MEHYLSGPCPNDMKPGDIYKIADGGTCFGGRQLRLVKVSDKTRRSRNE